MGEYNQWRHKVLKLGSRSLTQFCSKKSIQRFPLGFDKNKIHLDFKHVWNYRLGE